MKKKILSFVSAFVLIISLATPAFAVSSVYDFSDETTTNKTDVTIDALLDFIYSKGGRLATEAEMQQISDKVDEVNDLYRASMKQSSVINSQQTQATIIAAERELDALPCVFATYEELVELGFISPTTIAPIPPSPSSTRYVRFSVSTTTKMVDYVLYYYTRIQAVNIYASSSFVNAPLYFHSQTILFNNKDNVDSLIANGVKLLMTGASLTSDVSIPMIGPDELLGAAFAPRQTERLELNEERSLNFSYDYVASETLSTYYEMCTSEKLSFTYYYYYCKLLSNGSLTSQTTPSKTINEETKYYNDLAAARDHAIALFSSDPFEHEYYGFNSITVQLKAKVGSTTKTFSKRFGLDYYRTLTSIPGA